ncbi:LuxR C-terminal-related transcriptional regulator [Amycolatopsis sp. PS_44_ISF1]|uniref:LuxR C-terminal-related transcriptional regulator n=1 Tax=Amycolatopsis sp. PS_44_ISF1 TaxID=2974917 RepID=UPI0028DDBE94|nr:LuxR C-terminal-related transcriptional regulator [Amycolatopsis sp. PS_44_ISF1]MDT8914507.1 LuxR C-terminal-related transcriptional regulator [Amycolatopsis sp. PS_44_ISF1]
MLEGLLSAGAGALYDAMVRSGPVSLDDPRAAGPEMRELIDGGFVRRDHRDGPVLAPMEPIRAVDHAILGAQQRLVEQQRQIVAARHQLDLLQAVYRTTYSAGSDAAVEVLTDPQRIGALSLELCLSAKTDFVTFTTRHFKRKPDANTAMSLPAAVTERGVRLRNVYERAALEFEGAKGVVEASIAGGWTMRVAPELPMKMVIADQHSALVPLDPSGMEGAVFVCSPTIVAGLRMLFELVWSQAVPIGDDGRRHGLTPAQAKVLDLLATGMTDGAIARHLEVSERTVRRHVQGLLDALQADNRVAAVYAATRRGWLA